MTVRLTASDFKHMIDIAINTIPGGGHCLMSISFRMSLSNYWIDEVCKSLDNAVNDDGTKRYFLVPDVDTFKLNLDELYFGWQDVPEQNSLEEDSLDEDSLNLDNNTELV